MATIGEMRYYVTVKTYTQSKNAAGSSQRTLSKTLYYFVAIKEEKVSEKLVSGIAEGEKGISVEMVRVAETIKAGDELIYNGITYRIDSISMDHFKNRTYIYGKANDRG